MLWALLKGTSSHPPSQSIQPSTPSLPPTLCALCTQVGIPLGPKFVALAIDKIIDGGEISWLEGSELVALVEAIATKHRLGEKANPDFVIVIGGRLMQPQVLSTLNCGDLCNLVRSFASLGVKNEYVLDTIATRVAQALNEMAAAELVQVRELGMEPSAGIALEGGPWARYHANISYVQKYLFAQKVIFSCMPLAKMKSANNNRIFFAPAPRMY